MNTKHISKIRLRLSILLGVCQMFSLLGCGKTGQVMDGDGMTPRDGDGGSLLRLKRDRSR